MSWFLVLWSMLSSFCEWQTEGGRGQRGSSHARLVRTPVRALASALAVDEHIESFLRSCLLKSLHTLQCGKRNCDIFPTTWWTISRTHIHSLCASHYLDSFDVVVVTRD